MSLAGVAKENLAIYERGSYRAPSGRDVPVRDAIDLAVAGTVLYRPEDLDPGRSPSTAGTTPLRIEVTHETTGAAARRLIEVEHEARVVALNFASAKNPGGGFLGGAKAQEEDIARCSALYPCLLSQRRYYDANRAQGSMLYTDHIIYSPDVPFLRDERLDLLEEPFLVSIITAPAPNAGEYLRRHPDGRPEVRTALELRAARVLAVAAAQGHTCLVLGAWGCGVFRNDAAEVADVFAGALAAATSAGARFTRIVFAVFDRSPRQATLHAFHTRFPTV